MLSLWLAIYVKAFLPLCVVLAIASLRWGGRTERQASLAFVTAMAIGKVSEGSDQTMYSTLETGVAVLDVLLAAIFFSLAFRDPKTWLLGAAALQFLSAWAHVARVVNTGMDALPYAILTGSAGYPILILLSAGIVTYIRRQARMRGPGELD